MFLRCRKNTSLSRDQTPPRRTSSALVRIDQEFLAGGALGVNLEIRKLERFGQGHDFGIVAGKGGLELGDDALPELLAVDRPDLHQERKQQPAADAPGHSK